MGTLVQLGRRDQVRGGPLFPWQPPSYGGVGADLRSLSPGLEGWRPRRDNLTSSNAPFVRLLLEVSKFLPGWLHIETLFVNSEKKQVL